MNALYIVEGDEKVEHPDEILLPDGWDWIALPM